eukprot:TRINITY_DN15181_c0_g1_i1.p1 TRINITY_DN15181_c0_g1~~TRINITY_DN15181_c0_g1_i1.p1  ORF type:complete len:900 (-),score=140.57 TRINITY_DN15181_c0_g1_i1:42-2741(-)
MQKGKTARRGTKVVLKESYADLCSFYLPRNIVVAAGEPLPQPAESSLFDATRICLSLTGISPKLLSSYPSLIPKLQDTLNRANVKFIEDTFTIKLISFFEQKRNVSQYVEELLNSTEAGDRQLGARIFQLMKEVEECGICFTNDADTYFQCGHRVCGTCSTALKSCPYCRASILLLLQQTNQQDAPLASGKLPHFRWVQQVLPFVEDRFSGLLKKTSTLDSKAGEEFTHLIKFHPALTYQLFQQARARKQALSEEVRCYLAAKFFLYLVLRDNLGRAKWEPEDEAVAEDLKKLITSPSRLVRFLASIATNDEPVKDERVQLKLNNRFRLWLVQAVDRFDEEKGEQEMKQRKGYWVCLFKILHIREKKFNKYKNAQLLASFVRGNRKATHKPKMATFNNLYRNKDKQILPFLERHPDLVFRNFRCTLNRIHPKITVEQWRSFLGEVVPKMKPHHLVELLHILEVVPLLNETLPVYRTKTGKLYWYEKPKELPKREVVVAPAGRGRGRGGRGAVPRRRAPAVLAKKKSTIRFVPMTITEDFLQASREVIKNSFKRLPYHLVVEDPLYLKSMRLARGRPARVPHWVPHVSSPGDVLKINPNHQVVVFLHWISKERGIYLDLSAMCVTKSKQFGFIDYTCLSSFSVQHSGDSAYVGEKEGASEYITFVPSTVLAVQPDVEEMDILCFSWNGIAFDELGQVFVGIGIIDGVAKGLGPAGCTVWTGCELRGTSKINFTSKYNFLTHEFTFMNSNMSAGDRTMCSLSANKLRILSVSEKYKDWDKRSAPPSMFEVVTSLYHAVQEVTLVQGEERRYFKRREGETSVEFLGRIRSGRFDSKEDPFKNDNEKEKEKENENEKVLFIGNPERLRDNSIKLPKGTLVVSKADPKVEDLVWTSDPYTVFSQ